MRPPGSVRAKYSTVSALLDAEAMRPMRAACRTALAAAAFLAAGCVSPHGAVATDVNSASWRDSALSPRQRRHDDAPRHRPVPALQRPVRGRHADRPHPSAHAGLAPTRRTVRDGHSPGTYSAAISREADIPYRRRVLFDRTGDYHLTITPAAPSKASKR